MNVELRTGGRVPASDPVYEKIGRQPLYFVADGRRFLVPAMYRGDVAGLRPVGDADYGRYVDGVGTKWLVGRPLVATPPGQPQEYSWYLKQAEPDWRMMPEHWQYVPQFTPPGQPKRYLADGKHYVLREYPIEGGGRYQIAVATTKDWRPL